MTLGLGGAQIAQDHASLLEDIARTETPQGQGAFWWLGQHTFIVKAGGKVFYFDPWMADWPARQTPPLLTPQETQQADFALITHGHGDHLCPDTLPQMAVASPNALFVSPRTEAGRMEKEGCIPAARLRPLNAGETLMQDGVTITAIKAKHETFDEHPTLGFPFLGYVVEASGVTIYHAGDTILYDGLRATLRQWPRIDVMFLPINGRDAERYLRDCIGNMTFQEAAELAGDLNAGLAVPAHYDMFVGNQEDPSKFTRFLEAKYPGIPYWVGKAGERVLFGAATA
jgi:L-ascorbate 6-phosphate lactonase